MQNIKRTSRLGIALVLCLSAAGQKAATNSYAQYNISSDVAGMAHGVDPYLVNPWGLWDLGAGNSDVLDMADAGTGVVSGDTTGGAFFGYLTVPPASGSGAGSPSGLCSFPLKLLTVTTLDGTIQADLTGGATTIKVNNSAKGAVYTGCTLWTPMHNGPQMLFVTNSAGGVEEYDQNYNPISLPPGAFVDTNVPAGYTPYGIFSPIVPNGGSGNIWVTFFNGTPGPGQGYVDEFDSNGNLLLSLQHGNWMNQPYGIAKAPYNFGALSRSILVSMTGSGVIVAFNPSTGKVVGVLKDSSGQPMVNSGIRGISFGNGGFGSPTNTLFIVAGIDNFQHGLFASITSNN